MPFHRFVFLLAVTLAIGFPTAAAPPKPQEAAFWRWFQDNEPALLDMQTGREPIGQQLQYQLTKINPYLLFELRPEQDGKRGLVLSASGIGSAFAPLRSLVAAAPTLDRWEIIPFRPRRPFDKITVEGISVTPAAVRFQAFDDQGKIGLVLSFDGYQKKFHLPYQMIGMLILDAVLGEEALETRLGEVAITGDKARSKGAWQPISDLPKLVDAWRPRPPR